MRLPLHLSLLFAATAASCASAPPPPSAPDYSEPASLAAPAKSVLYTDCIAQAIARSAVARHSRGGAELIGFTCTGAPAQRFYEALALLGEAAGSVWVEDGHTFRATSKVEKDLFGIDYCAPSTSGGATCRIVLNAGSFLTAAPG